MKKILPSMKKINNSINKNGGTMRFSISLPLPPT